MLLSSLCSSCCAVVENRRDVVASKRAIADAVAVASCPILGAINDDDDDDDACSNLLETLRSRVGKRFMMLNL